MTNSAPDTSDFAIGKTFPASGATRERLHIGTHRRAQKNNSADMAFGIYSYERSASGEPFRATGLTETLQPGWIAVHPGGNNLYAVNEMRTMGDHNGGAVTAFAIDPDNGKLTPLNSAPLPPMPCHCAVDASGRFLLVATFGGGSLHLFALQADGRIGVELDLHVHRGSSAHPVRQTGPHAHAVVIDPGNGFVLVPDLGIDRLLVYRLDHDHGRLIPLPERMVALPPLSGPRHLAFAPSARHAYLINEMNATISVFAWDGATGTLDLLQSVDLLPVGFEGLRSGAAIAVHPDGRHLYATTRSHGSSGMPPKPGLDQLVWFDIDPATGCLSPGGSLDPGGGIPRDFAIAPSGNFLYVGLQRSGRIVEYALDNGIPSATGRTMETPVPVCLTFSP